MKNVDVEIDECDEFILKDIARLLKVTPSELITKWVQKALEVAIEDIYND